MASPRKSTSSTSTTISINLDLSDDNDIVHTGELIQLDRYNSLKNEIERDLKRVTTREWPSVYPAGSGLVYFIDGTRGAGKSTFLRSTFNGLPKIFVKNDSTSPASLILIPAVLKVMRSCCYMC